MKLLLNKLTPDNYERLKDQVLTILLEGKDQQAKIINVIFKKACLEEKYCKLYTALCDYLARQEVKAEGLADVKQSRFRKDLIQECKSVFDEFFQVPVFDDKMDKEDREEAVFKFRKRLFGNVKFIGELFLKRMLGRNIVLQVLNELLEEEKRAAESGEERSAAGLSISVEGVCIMLNAVGKRLDKKSSKGEKAKGMVMEFEEIAEKLDEMKARVESRIRFLIINIQERRAKGWEENAI